MINTEKRDLIRGKMYAYSLTQAWAIHILAKNGVIVPQATLSNALSGKNQGAEATYVLDRLLDILTKYEEAFEK